MKLDVHLHVSETQWPRCSKGDKSNEISEHCKTNALSTDRRWKDLSRPYERWAIDELEEHNEHENEDHAGDVTSSVCGCKE